MNTGHEIVCRLHVGDIIFLFKKNCNYIDNPCSNIQPTIMVYLGHDEFIYKGFLKHKSNGINKMNSKKYNIIIKRSIKRPNIFDFKQSVYKRLKVDKNFTTSDIVASAYRDQGIELVKGIYSIDIMPLELFHSNGLVEI